MKWKWVERGALALVVFVLALGSIGFAYERRAEEAERNALSIPGRIVPVDGFQMHLHCTGVGSPTVLLEAGTVGYAQSWGRIQSRLSETTRVCSYDRAGLGWSEDWGGHDGRTIAHNLRALLHAGGEAGPFVVVGHSLGASFARIFAGAYREEVVGMAMLDPAHPDPLDGLGTEARFDPDELRRTVGVASRLARFGVLRVADFVRGFHPIPDVGLVPGLDLVRDFDWARATDLPEEGASGELPGADALAGAFFLSSPGHLTAAHAELLAWDETVEAARRVDDLGEVPLTIISSTGSTDGPVGGVGGRPEVGRRIHAELAGLSARGRHVAVAGADPFSLLGNPKHADEVSEHLRAVVEDARADAPSRMPCADPADCWTSSSSSTE